jgi:hypothetical protein
MRLISWTLRSGSEQTIRLSIHHGKVDKFRLTPMNDWGFYSVHCPLVQPKTLYT